MSGTPHWMFGFATLLITAMLTSCVDQSAREPGGKAATIASHTSPRVDENKKQNGNEENGNARGHVSSAAVAPPAAALETRDSLKISKVDGQLIERAAPRMTEPARPLQHDRIQSMDWLALESIRRSPTTSPMAVPRPKVTISGTSLPMALGNPADPASLTLVPSTPAVATMPPASTASQTDKVKPNSELLVSTFWNGWLTNDRQRFNPTKKISPGAKYIVRLQLAPFSYGSDEAGVTSAPTSKTTSDSLRKWLTELPDDVETVDLDAVLIYDTTFFEASSLGTSKRFQLSIRKIRDWMESRSTSAPASGDVFRRLKEGDREFVFAGEDVQFSLTAKERFPVNETWASVALSIWDPQKGIPLDEVSFSVCAASTCQGVQRSTAIFDGFDAVKASLGAGAQVPEAAIHLIQFAGDYLWGVFSQRTKSAGSPGERTSEPQYLPWSTGKTFAQMREYMQNAVSSVAKLNEAGMLSLGEDLLGELIPSGGNDRAKLVNQSFVNFVKSYSSAEPYLARELPALFIRIAVREAAEQPTLWPFSLISTPIGRNNERQFIGRIFRIESPLTNQNSETEDSCIREWMVVGPARTGTTAQARPKLTTVEAERIGLDDLTLRVGNGVVTITDDMSEFHKYVHGDGELNSPPPISESPILISVLSHHDNNSIFLEDSPDAFVVRAGHVERTFMRSSVVLLNGCGTGRPGASELIGRLNRAGVHAAIATLAEVSPEMAGDFLECFLREIEDAPVGGISLGVAHSRTLRCLEARVGLDEQKYGPKALMYGLLGNSGLRVCEPRRVP